MIIIMIIHFIFRLISLLRDRRSLFRCGLVDRTCHKCDNHSLSVENEDFINQCHISDTVISQNYDVNDHNLNQNNKKVDKMHQKSSIFIVDPIYQIVSEKSSNEEVIYKFNNDKNIVYDIISTKEVAKYRPITPKILRR